MPANKNVLLRIRIIDACLTNKMHRYPSREYILEKIEDQLGTTISASMFAKDLDHMRTDYGAPIEFSRAHKGYYYAEENFSISQFPLTHAEIEALDHSTAMLQQVKHTPLYHHFEKAINKVIDGYRIEKLTGMMQRTVLQVEEAVKNEGNEWLEPLLSAITRREGVSILYQRFGQEPKEHIFSPYLLKEYRNRWYTVGHSAATDTVLVLALDRISAIQYSEHSYVQDEQFSPEAFFTYSFGITQLHDEKPEMVKLLFAPAQAPYILSQPLHHSQEVLKQDEEGLHISLQVYITRELIMSVLSYGAAVKVLAPSTFVQTIREEIAAMGKCYGG